MRSAKLNLFLQNFKSNLSFLTLWEVWNFFLSINLKVLEFSSRNMHFSSLLMKHVRKWRKNVNIKLSNAMFKPFYLLWKIFPSMSKKLATCTQVNLLNETILILTSFLLVIVKNVESEKLKKCKCIQSANYCL